MDDFEKLLFAENYNKELKRLLSKAEFTIGVLKSDISELKDTIEPLKRRAIEAESKLLNSDCAKKAAHYIKELESWRVARIRLEGKIDDYRDQINELKRQLYAKEAFGGSSREVPA